MNIVYRGVNNPIQIATSNSKLIEAKGIGLTKIDDFGNYKISPQSGTTVDINVKAVTKFGDTITDTKTLRILNLGKPITTINDRRCDGPCVLHMKKEAFLNGKLNVEITKFMFDLKLEILSFKVKVEGKPYTQTIHSDKIQAYYFEDLKVGSIIQIFEVKIKTAPNVVMKPPSGLTIKIIE